MAMIQDMVASRQEIEAARAEADTEVKNTFRQNVGLMIIECNQAKLTQGGLAEMIGTSSQNLANWRDGIEPSLVHLKRLERAWGLDFTVPIDEGKFFRILTGQDKGLYLGYGSLISVPDLVT